MSYHVLARKWRPRTFKDMIGQEHIVRMLTNALEQKRLHHAYLFTGTRGVGKTTLARILAKCLNCETGITATPCDVCHTCQAVNNNQFLDLYEIDAASRTKVEDTRELLDNVLYPPTQGRYKIYLIDEVHMLSNHSFNALLKTLEEPPEYVKFLLATTDPKRLPITILSRCLQFHLKRISPEQITKHLQHICGAEKINSERSALDRLAQAADGSMRDALSLLDQAIAHGQGCVNKNDVDSMLGNVIQDDLLPLLDALATQNGKQLFALTHQLAESAPEFQQVLEEFISILHKIALLQIIPDMEADEALKSLAKQFTPEDVQLYYQIALLGRRDLALAPAQKQGFEMTMLRMLAFKPSFSGNNVQEMQTKAKPNTNSSPEIKIAKAAPLPKENIAKAETETKITALWRELLPQLGLSGMAYALASNCSLVKMTDNKIELALSSNHKPMLNQKLKDRMEENLSQHFKRPLQLEINVTTEELFTPLKHHHQEQNQRLANATQTIMDDPQVKKLIDMYEATVEVSLISRSTIE